VFGCHGLALQIPSDVTVSFGLVAVGEGIVVFGEVAGAFTAGRGTVVVVAAAVVLVGGAVVVLVVVVVAGALVVVNGAGSATGSGDLVSAQSSMSEQHAASTAAVTITMWVCRRVIRAVRSAARCSSTG
jgi:hypothetical protein